jgi:hypothetical protein
VLVARLVMGPSSETLHKLGLSLSLAPQQVASESGHPPGYSSPAPA